MKRLADEADKVAKRGVRVVLVNVSESDVSKVHKWVKDYGDPKWPLIMDTRAQMVVPFGLAKKGAPVSLPQTLVLDNALAPLFLLGTEGDDWPEVLWENEL
jgi:alkyl hydroperoxide reductase subunit AhpC